MSFLILFAFFVFYKPNYLGHSINFEVADALKTPEHIVPEWYFLPFYAILRAIPDKLGGVLAMGGAIVILFFLPWLDTSRVRSAKYRPIFRQFFWLFVINVVILGVVGANPAEGWWIIVGQFCTAYYFLHFLLIIPLVGLIENPKPLPASISESVLAKQPKSEPAAQPAE